MTNSASSLMAIMLGLGVFAIIVALGWRSVQNRRILRVQGGNGQETIIVAREDDDISSVVTTTTQTRQPASASEFGGSAAKSEAAADAEADATGRDRLDRIVSSTE